MGSGHDVELFDITTIDGLAEAAYYSVKEAPFIIIERVGVGDQCRDEDLPVDDLIEEYELTGKCRDAESWEKD